MAGCKTVNYSVSMCKTSTTDGYKGLGTTRVISGPIVQTLTNKKFNYNAEN